MLVEEIEYKMEKERNGTDAQVLTKAFLRFMATHFHSFSAELYIIQLVMIFCSLKH